MSKLKEKLVRKLNNTPSIQAYFDELTQDDITFVKNGCRNDVVRWVLGRGIHCYSGATLCVKEQVELIYDDGLLEVIAQWPSDILPRDLK